MIGDNLKKIMINTPERIECFQEMISEFRSISGENRPLRMLAKNMQIQKQTMQQPPPAQTSTDQHPAEEKKETTRPISRKEDKDSSDYVMSV